jgi:hypothetical protein
VGILCLTRNDNKEPSPPQLLPNIWNQIVVISARIEADDLLVVRPQSLWKRSDGNSFGRHRTTDGANHLRHHRQYHIDYLKRKQELRMMPWVSVSSAPNIPTCAGEPYRG